jgi:hypothetical protein
MNLSNQKSVAIAILCISIFFSCTPNQASSTEKAAIKDSIAFISNKDSNLFAKPQTSEPKTPEPQTMVGEWEWIENDDRNSFSLTITENKTDFLVSYCCVQGAEGQRIDCFLKNEYAFSCPKTSNQTISSDFESAYTGSEGHLTLSLNGNNLVWTVDKVPNETFFCPTKAIFKKQ